MASLLSTFLLLVAVAFFTLLERKVLAYIMLRKGPNKPFVIGTLIPIADALKLLAKPFVFPVSSSSGLMVFSCLLAFIIPCQLFTFVHMPSSYLSFDVTVLGILI